MVQLSGVIGPDVMDIVVEVIGEFGGLPRTNGRSTAPVGAKVVIISGGRTACPAPHGLRLGQGRKQRRARQRGCRKKQRARAANHIFARKK